MMTMMIVVSLIGNLLVAIVTTAPLASVEKTDNLAKEDSSVDRGKRAEEEIYFGNQQNKARTVVKKSVIPPSPGVDLGGDVVALPQEPIDQDVVDRAEAALDRGGEDEKNAQAMEAAMQSAVQSVIDSNESDVPMRTEDIGTIEDIKEAGDQSEEDSQSEEENKLSKEVESAAEEEPLSSESSNEVKEVEEQGNDNDKDVEDSDQTSDEKELQEAASSSQSVVSSAVDPKADDVTSDEQTNVETEVTGGEEKQDSNDEDDLNLQELNNVKDNTISYWPPYPVQRPSNDKPVVPRGCVFYPGMSSYWCPFAEHRNRIKRDLRDDIYPYSAYPSEYEDDRSYETRTPYESDNSVNDVYKMILNMVEENYLNRLADQYAEMQEEELPYDPRYLPEEDDDSSEVDSEEDFIPETEALSPYALRYSYEPEEVEPLRRREAKRSEYYAPEYLEKRYFYPFNDEPETHWGAFVPEKRNHDDALRRLQRLAVALGDNHGPLYRELIGEYERRRR